MYFLLLIGAGLLYFVLEDDRNKRGKGGPR